MHISMCIHVPFVELMYLFITMFITLSTVINHFLLSISARPYRHVDAFGGSPRRNGHFPIHLFNGMRPTVGTLLGLHPDDFLTIIDFIPDDQAASLVVNNDIVGFRVGTNFLAHYGNHMNLTMLCRAHKISLPSNAKSVSRMVAALSSHSCKTSPSCSDNIMTIFRRPIQSRVNPWNLENPFRYKDNLSTTLESDTVLPDIRPIMEADTCKFPPLPPSKEFLADIVRQWCSHLSTEALEEFPCAVCAQATIRSQLVSVSMTDPCFDLLDGFRPAVTPKHLQTASILCPAGITTNQGVECANVCKACWRALQKQTLPDVSLANGLWLGDVPPELSRLNFVEKLMVACYRHNVCVITVGVGQRKMRANAIVFSQPVARFHERLPQSRAEMDECLAVVFLGSSTVSGHDLRRTPLIIRRK